MFRKTEFFPSNLTLSQTSCKMFTGIQKYPASNKVKLQGKIGCVASDKKSTKKQENRRRKGSQLELSQN